MKAEKIFLGSLAVVISLVGSGCAGTTAATRSSAGFVGNTLADPGPMPVSSWEPPSHAESSGERLAVAVGRSSPMSLRTVSSKSR